MTELPNSLEWVCEQRQELVRGRGTDVIVVSAVQSVNLSDYRNQGKSGLCERPIQPFK